MYISLNIYIYIFSETKTSLFKSNHFVMVGSSRFHHREILANECVTHDQTNCKTLTNTKRDVNGRT